MADHNQDIESDAPSPELNKRGSGSELFDKQYYADRKEEERLQHLRNRDEAAYFYEMQRKTLKDRLFYEIKKYIDDAPDITLVEKDEILGVVRKFTVTELTSLKDKIIKKGIKEGLAVLKSQKKFMKGQQKND